MEPGDEFNQPAPGTEHVEEGAASAGSGAGDTGEGWQEPEAEEAQAARNDQAARAREAAQRWVGQLQEMIDHAGHTAGPVLRDVAAKAAELAAVAAENAGPIARRAADVTENVGEKLATRSKELAAELRRAAEADRASQSAGGNGTGEPPVEPPAGPTGSDGPEAGGPVV